MLLRIHFKCTHDSHPVLSHCIQDTRSPFRSLSFCVIHTERNTVSFVDFFFPFGFLFSLFCCLSFFSSHFWFFFLLYFLSPSFLGKNLFSCIISSDVSSLCDVIFLFLKGTELHDLLGFGEKISLISEDIGKSRSNTDAR